MLGSRIKIKGRRKKTTKKGKESLCPGDRKDEPREGERKKAKRSTTRDDAKRSPREATQVAW